MNFYETENYTENTVLDDMTDCHNILENFFGELRKFESQVSQMGCFANNFDDNIRCAFAEVSNELNKRLMALCQELCTKKQQIQKEALKNRTEIYNLTRENKQLSEQIMRLKQQIEYMESTIGKNGQNARHSQFSSINYYKTK